MKSYINPKTNKQMVVYHCECGKQEFKTKYSELCENCELKPKIKEGIENQIIAEAKIKQSILTKEQFVTYINNEIKNASDTITNRLLAQRNQKEIDPKNEYVGTRIMGVIWNSERIKALNKFTRDENPYPKVFQSANSFNIFKEFINNHKVTPYKDLSFLFQKLKSQERIFKIKHLEFAQFLLKEEFIKEKDYNEISNKKGFDNKSFSVDRDNNYNLIEKKVEDNI